MTKREYLCVMTNGGVYRLLLDIGKLRNREKIPPKLNVPPHVELEKLEVDNSPTGKLPYYMQPILLDDSDRLILAGGWVPRPQRFLETNPNIDVAYEIANDRVKPIIPSPLCSIPDLCSWLAKVGQTRPPGVCIYQYGSSVYVLDATDPQNLSFRKFELKSSRQTVLPNPPDDVRVLNQTSWGYKFHITGCPDSSSSIGMIALSSIGTRTASSSIGRRTASSSIGRRGNPALLRKLTQTVAYTFDLLHEKWDRCHIEFRAAVQYQGFLIGIIPSGKLVCCPMDSYGNPNQLTPMRVLHDMFDICMLRQFYSFDVESIFTGLYKDGEDDYIWLVYTLGGPDADLHVHMPFVLFRVFYQNDVLCTVVEASDHYDDFRGSHLFTAFVYADPAE